MHFYDQTWFWAPLFAVIGSLGAIVIKEWLGGKTQAKLERLRIHESELVVAWRTLYEFVAHAQSTIWPPADPRNDFIVLMQKHYFKHVKPNMLLFSSDIRQSLEQFESQYHSLSDPDAILDPSFDEFIRSTAFDRLQERSRAVEKRMDKILHQW